MDDILKFCGTSDKLSLILRGGDVTRYHAESRDVDRQTVSDHTWRVLVLLLHLFPDASRDLIVATLYHDVAECVTGDSPALTKRNIPELKNALDMVEEEFHRSYDLPFSGDLSPSDHARLKTADYLELFLTTVRQPLPEAQDIAKIGLRLTLAYASSVSAEDNVKEIARQAYDHNSRRIL